MNLEFNLSGYSAGAIPPHGTRRTVRRQHSLRDERRGCCADAGEHQFAALMAGSARLAFLVLPNIKSLRTPIRGDTELAFITLDPPQTNVDFTVEVAIVITTSYPVLNAGSCIVPIQHLLTALINEFRDIVNGIP